MRVTFNTTYQQASYAIAEAASEMADRQEQVATGKRLKVPSDDPSASAAAVAERSELSVTDQYRQSADTVTSRLTVLDTVLSSLIDEMTAVKVAAQSGSGTVPDTQRTAAADTILALRESIYSAVNTQYRGVYPMSGSDATTPPYSRSGDVISSYQGTSNIIEVDIDRQMSVPVVIDAGSVLKGDDAQDIFEALDTLAAAVRSGDQTGIQNGMSRIDRTFQRLNRALGAVGADMAMVESQQNRLDSRQLASNTRLDALENVDLAEAISAMTQADTAYRAAVSAVGKTSQYSLLDYIK
jgi:flagellar hook-associated protein 3 FlgL